MTTRPLVFDLTIHSSEPYVLNILMVFAVLLDNHAITEELISALSAFMSEVGTCGLLKPEVLDDFEWHIREDSRSQLRVIATQSRMLADRIDTVLAEEALVHQDAE